MALSLYQLKPRFQQLLRPLLGTLARSGVTPNQVTLAAMALSVGYSLLLAWMPAAPALWFGVPLFFLLRMALNAIDGMLATVTGAKTALGALLNELCDQIADAALYLPFALAAGVHPTLLVLTVVAAQLTEFAGVLAPSLGVARRFDGPMGKSDRAFAFGLLALMIGVRAAPAWCNGVLVAVLVLSVLTIVNRLRQALRPGAPSTP